MAEKVVSGIQRILLPQLQEIKGELKAINARIDSVEAKVDSFRNEFRSELKRIEDTGNSNFKRFEEKTEGNFRRLDEKIDGLSVQLEIQRNFQC